MSQEISQKKGKNTEIISAIIKKVSEKDFIKLSEPNKIELESKEISAINPEPEKVYEEANDNINIEANKEVSKSVVNFKEKNNNKKELEKNCQELDIKEDSNNPIEGESKEHFYWRIKTFEFYEIDDNVRLLISK